MRWKPVLNAFAVTFADRMPTAEDGERARCNRHSVGSGRGALSGLLAGGFPRPARRTRRAPLNAPGSPRVLAVGQPSQASQAAGSSGHGVGILFPR